MNRCERGVRSPTNTVFDVPKEERQTREEPPDILGISFTTRKLRFAAVYTTCLRARLQAGNPGKARNRTACDARGGVVSRIFAEAALTDFRAAERSGTYLHFQENVYIFFLLHQASG